MGIKPKPLTILTLNAGLLDVEIFGRPILEPAPYVNERLKALPKALIKTKADVIALQEIYEQPHRLFLIKELHKTYLHHFYSSQHRTFKLDDSLIIFSKYPIIHRKVLAFKNSVLEDRLVAFKGVLVAKIEVPGWRPLTFYNMYTVAGGIRDPQNKTVEAARGEEIHEIIQCIQKTKGHPIKIVLGDLNAGLEVSKSNYDIFAQYNFVDALPCTHPKYAKKSWYPNNSLNIGGPHKNCPPQLIDHVFFRKQDLKHLKIKKAEVVLEKPIVKLPGGEKITISDHAGILVTFSALPRPS